MKQYTAYESGHRAIITIFATDKNHARERITQELSKIGRTAYLQRWRRDGCIIQEKK